MGPPKPFFLLPPHDALPAIDAPKVLGLIVHDFAHPFEDHAQADLSQYVDPDHISVRTMRVSDLLKDHNSRNVWTQLRAAAQAQSGSGAPSTEPWPTARIRCVQLQHQEQVYQHMIMSDIEDISRLVGRFGTAYMAVGFCVWEDVKDSRESQAPTEGLVSSQSPSDNIETNPRARASRYLKADPEGAYIFAIQYRQVHRSFGVSQPRLQDRDPRYRPGETFGKGLDIGMWSLVTPKEVEKDLPPTPPPPVRSGQEAGHGASDLDGVTEYVLAILGGAAETRMSLDVAWEIPPFLFDNFVPESKLSDVPVVTGIISYAKACSCKEYMSEQSDNLGTQLLGFLDETILDIFQGKEQPRTESIQVLESGSTETTLKVTLKASLTHLEVEAFGVPRVLARLAQVLAWLCAAVRDSSHERLTYSQVSISYNNPCFEIRLDPLKEGVDSTTSEEGCWQHLFKHTVVAKTTAVKRLRDTAAVGRGLEIPFEVMAYRAGIQHEVYMDGGSVLMGFSTLLIPVQKLDNGIQWHLEVWDPEGGHIPLSVISKKVGQNWLKVKELGELTKETAYLGWGCDDVQILLGTRELVNAPTKIAQSNAESLTFGFRLDSVDVGVNDGFNIKGFTLQTNIKANFKREDKFIPYSKSINFGNLLETGAKEYALLYDTKAKRAWLVPKLSLLLHMAHTYIRKFETGAELPFVQAVSAGGRAARDLIVANQVLPMRIDENTADENTAQQETAEQNNTPRPEGEQLDAHIVDLWARLELTKQILDNANTDGDTIYGFDFMDIAAKQSPAFLRKAPIQKSTAGGWLQLCKTRRLWVVLCSELGEAVGPRMDPNSPCKQTSLIEGKDYLGTTTACLEGFAGSVGGDRLLDKVGQLDGRRILCRHTPSSYYISTHEPGSSVARCCCIKPQSLKKHPEGWERSKKGSEEEKLLADVMPTGGIVMGSK